MTPAELQHTLAKIHARSARVLTHALLDDRSREDCARLYGITPGQWDVLFLRAARDFERALQNAPPSAPQPHLGELTAAPALRDALAARSTPLALALLELREQRDAVKVELARAEATHEASAAYAVEVWLRRIAIVAILALTAYFAWRDEQLKPVVHTMPYSTEPKDPPK